MQNHYQFSPASKNVKTGPIPTSISPSSTCPPACPFSRDEKGKSRGCYAAQGPLSWIWKKVDKGMIGHTWENFLAKIQALPRNQLWRHNVAGCLNGENNRIDENKLNELVAANTGRNGYTYTHYPMDGEHGEHNAKVVKAANERGFTINLSGNSVAHADKLKAKNIAPVVCVVPEGTPNSFISPAGNKVVVCPAQTRENVSCATCGLCQKSKRGAIVAFIAHGMMKKETMKASESFA